MGWNHQSGHNVENRQLGWGSGKGKSNMTHYKAIEPSWQEVTVGCTRVTAVGVVRRCQALDRC